MDEGILGNIFKESGVEPVKAETPQETPVEKVEEPIEKQEAPTEKVDTPPVEKAEKPVPTPATNWFDELKKETGRELKDVDEVRSVFEKYDKYGEIESKYTELDSTYKKTAEEASFYKKELEELAKIADPLSTFNGNVDAYRNWVITSKLSEGKNPSVVSKIVNELDTMSDIDILVSQIKYDAPDVVKTMTDEDIKMNLYKNAGVDVKAYEEENEKPFNVVNPDLSSGQLMDLKIKASLAKSKFSDLKNKVEVPEVKDRFKEIQDKYIQTQDKQKQILDKWELEADRIAETLPNIEYKTTTKDGEEITDFTFEMDSEYRKQVPKMVIEYALKHNIEPSKENIDVLKNELVSTYEKINMHKIREAYAKEREAAIQEEYDKRYNNPQPFNDTSAPPIEQDESFEANTNKAAEQMLKDMNSSWK